MKIQMKFEGGAKLSDALTQVSNRVGRQLVRQALREAAVPMQAAVAAAAPRGEVAPHLAEHIVVSNARPEDGSVGIALGPQKGAFFYGSFLEHGTVKMPAYPFMRPGFEASVQHSIRIMQTALWGLLVARGVGSARASGAGAGLE